MLEGIRVLDLGGIGPGPYASMLLADLGAEVIRVTRTSEPQPVNPVLDRGKKSVCLDLKSPHATPALARLSHYVDAVVEGFRPGVAERLGAGPADLMAANPALVYGRVTGWGQTGPQSQQPGHDLNYIAASGLLSRLGRTGEAPQFPVNLLGDFGGGGMQLALGIVSGLLRAQRTGHGTVVDAAMMDGANHLWSMMFGFEALGMWNDRRGENLLDSGAPFYDVYPTADGGHLGVGCIEPQFFAEFVTALGIADKLPAPLAELSYRKPEYWPALRELFSAAIAARTTTELAELFDGSDACATVVLSMDEVETHPHNAQRAFLYRDDAGVRQPAPIPRFADLGETTWSGGRSAADASATEPYRRPAPAAQPGEHTDEVLTAAGFSPEEIARLTSATS